MPTEDQSRPRRDLKALWLLPVLALALGTLVTSWKKPTPPPMPTAFQVAEQAKQDAYRQAKYLLISRVMQGQPKGYTVIGYAPYAPGMVSEIGPARFRCSSRLRVRSRTGLLRQERWQCVISGSRNNWVCEGFRHTPPERVTPRKVRPGPNAAGVA